jgi:hypothetical protein
MTLGNQAGREFEIGARDSDVDAINLSTTLLNISTDKANQASAAL